MKFSKLLFLPLIAVLVACNGKNAEKTTGQFVDDQDEPIEPTSYVVEKVSYSDTITVGVSSATARCNIAYLKTDNPDAPLIMSIDNWIRDMLQNAPDTIEIGAPLAKSIVDEILSSNRATLIEMNDFAEENNDGFMQYGEEYSYDIHPLALSPGFVTMLYESYIYTGGAHGGSYCIGQTFSAFDGSLVDLDMFKDGSTDKVLALIKKGLMSQYFKVDSDKEFYNYLLINGNKLPLPATPPYFTDKGVCFHYQQYEIAPYAAGMPKCVIPFEDLKPYLSEYARNLIADKL